MGALVAARDWLAVYRLPPYVHELNPGAGLVPPQAVSGQAKPGQLTALVKTRLKRMQYRPGPLDGSLASTDPDLTLFSNSQKMKLVYSIISGRPAKLLSHHIFS